MTLANVHLFGNTPFLIDLLKSLLKGTLIIFTDSFWRRGFTRSRPIAFEQSMVRISSLTPLAEILISDKETLHSSSMLGRLTLESSTVQSHL